jgi:hypothetical protein
LCASEFGPLTEVGFGVEVALALAAGDADGLALVAGEVCGAALGDGAAIGPAAVGFLSANSTSMIPIA